VTRSKRRSIAVALSTIAATTGIFAAPVAQASHPSDLSPAECRQFAYDWAKDTFGSLPAAAERYGLSVQEAQVIIREHCAAD
jgi:hypothetical protein